MNQPNATTATTPQASDPLVQIDEALASLQTKSDGLDIDFLSTTLSNARTAVADSLHRATAAAKVPALQEKIQELSASVELKSSQLQAATAHATTFETLTSGIKSGLLGKIALAYEKDLQAGWIEKVNSCTNPSDLINLSLQITLAFNAKWAQQFKPVQESETVSQNNVIQDPSIFSTRRK